MIVYMILNEATEMSYIGKCTGSLEDRWRSHVEDAENGSTTRFHVAIKEWGKEVWTPVILQHCYTEQELSVAEGNWIAYLDTCDPHVGYNTYLPHNAYDVLCSWLNHGRTCNTLSPSKVGKRAFKNPKSARHREDMTPAEIEFFRECGRRGARPKDQMTPTELEKYREYGRKGAERARQKRLGRA